RLALYCGYSYFWKGLSLWLVELTS
ncbi:hypothetical protein Tco_1469070, partial [Tanacetum coccineum]